MSESTLVETRVEKLAKLRSLGFDPFLIEKFDRSHSLKDAQERFEMGATATLAGRITSLRQMGKAMFLDLSDGDNRFQIYIKRDDLKENEWEAANLLDLGDHLGVRGFFFITRTEEKSLHAQEIIPLSKALLAPPFGKEKDGHVFYGLTDVEERYRRRNLDLISNKDVRRVLLSRSKIVTSVRRYFDENDYVEVETPMLQVQAGGAAARPFTTHFNAYEMEVKLRISLELYLKRLICGDIERVFEIGRVFRNEGVSNRHNPEFTMLEFYEAYANLEDMMVRVEDLFRYVAKDVFGSTLVGIGDDSIDFGKDWARVDLLSEIEARSGVTAKELETVDGAKAAFQRLGIPTDKETHLGGMIEKLLEKFVEPHLIQPTFVVGYPIDTSPLAKKDPNRTGFTRRFEGYVRGREICNAFSEINDPIDQRARFENQVAEREKGDDEAHPLDEEFLIALEGGMPPTGGVGIGIDRMTMLLTGMEHIREVLLFPMMKPVG